MKNEYLCGKMFDNHSTNRDLVAIKRFSIKLRIIAVALSCIVIVCLWMFFRHQAQDRERRRDEAIAQMEAEIRREEAAQVVRDSLAELERMRRRAIEDSIRIATKPSYSIADVHKMVRSRVPAYSWIYLWRKDNDNWIMQYTLEYGDKEHHFMQRFNPTVRKFERAIEYSSTFYRHLDDIHGVDSSPKNVRCRFSEDQLRGTLDYYEDDIHFGEYTRKGIEHDCRLPSKGHGPLTKKRIRALDSSPSEWVEDGYESAEDWYYDNEEDFYQYYGR